MLDQEGFALTLGRVSVYIGGWGRIPSWSECEPLGLLTLPAPLWPIMQTCGKKIGSLLSTSTEVKKKNATARSNSDFFLTFSRFFSSASAVTGMSGV